jgi:hypothetical protein
MPERISLGKSAGIAGKETVATALIVWGISKIQGPDWYLGAGAIALGFVLHFIQPYIE